jgi:hypothetical protein
MDQNYARTEARILCITETYFPYVTIDNFPNLFRLSVATVERLVRDRHTRKEIRNFLIFLFHLRHYLPVRAGCILFNLEKSQYEDILWTEIQNFLNKHLLFYFDLEQRQISNEAQEFPNTFLVVDTTEVIIQTFTRKSFSGKKKHFTLKYQLAVGLRTGEILDVYGPCLGSVHDAKIWKESRLGDLLEDADEFILGDKGYIGCNRVVHPHKKQGFQPLSQVQVEFNRKLSHYRILVENMNANIKNWSILSHVYRGDVDRHRDIFLCCVILTNMMSEH